MRSRSRFWPARLGVAAALAGGLGGCATLPSNGPTAGMVTQAAREQAIMPMVLTDLTPEVIAAANRGARVPPSLAALATPGAANGVGPGDILQITIFEIGAALFAGGAAGAGAGDESAPTALGQTLPPATVSSDGTINVPYVGLLHVAGMTTEQIAQEIVARMIGMSQRPQVTVTVRENVSNTVFVMGAVKTSGRIPLTFARERLLDAIAIAGGPLLPTGDSLVRVTRGGQSAERPLADIRAGAADDLTLLPGDRIELLANRRTFTVFGAADKVSEIPFEADALTLAQAIARAGGPADQQADPTAVFLFRYTESGTPQDEPVAQIYRLNLMRPESYFLAQRFAMRPDDVLYIANARSNQTAKLVQIINQLFSPFYAARELTR